MKNLSLLVKPAAGLCNMRCGYCFYRAASESRENRIMRPETADELIRKIGAFRPAELSVAFQGGEPTLAGLDFFRRFVRELKEAAPCAVSFSLQTNGLLLDDAWAAFFKENGFLIGVSLDGGRRTNDRYRVDANGESVFPRILSAISVLEKHGVDFNILSVIENRNAAETEATWRYFKKHGFRFLQFIPFVDGEAGVALSEESYGTFLKRSFDLWYEDLRRGDYVSVRHIDNYVGILMGRQPESCAMRGACGGYFVAEANGSLYPCDFYCTAEYKLGSVSDAAPFDLNKKQQGFIEASALIREHCKACRWYVLCRGGCRRDRTDGLTKNKYCAAYSAFFEYAIERMEKAAELFLRSESLYPYNSITLAM